jgi:hypothetical protein
MAFHMEQLSVCHFGICDIQLLLGNKSHELKIPACLKSLTSSQASW